MKKRRWYVALLVTGLTIMTVPVLSAQEQGSTQSPSELRANVHTQKDERISGRCRAFQRDHSRWL
jgi:hypothetical protein